MRYEVAVQEHGISRQRTRHECDRFPGFHLRAFGMNEVGHNNAGLGFVPFSGLQTHQSG